jgi:opacity protein-like surface antigen
MKLRMAVCLLFVLTLEAPSFAEAEPAQVEESQQKVEESEEGLGEVEEYKNGIIFGFSHQFHLLRDRGDPIGAALGHKENLLGFMLAFERVFHPHVSVTFVKAFYFNEERLDSPFEILINGLYRKNKWEPVVAAGIISNIRVFYSVRDENGVAEKEFSVGLRFVAGFKYFVTPHWAVSFEFGYSFFPGNDVVEHELSDSYLGAYFF